MKFETFAVGHVGCAQLIKNEGKSSLLAIDLATNYRIGGKETTTWIRVKIWNERGEKLAPHMQKGTLLLVRGRCEAKAFKRNDGSLDADLVLHANDVEFLSAKKTAEEFGEDGEN